MKKVTTLDELNHIIANNDKVVVYFYTKQIIPEVEKVESEVSNVLFVKVDVYENEDEWDAFLITSIPTFFFFVNDRIVKSVNGAHMDKFMEALNNL